MRRGRVAGPQRLLLDEAYLSGFGHLRLPQHLYTALQRFDAWIEPALLAEWAQADQRLCAARKPASKTGGRRRMTGCWVKGLGLKRRRVYRWWVVVTY